MKSVITYGYPRLHFALTDMSAASARMYGGCGISFQAFPVIAEAVQADELSLSAESAISERTQGDLLAALRRAEAAGLPVNCRLHIHFQTRQHIGLGSATQILLTALDAIAGLYSWNLPPKEMIRISGRGRTSLIGCATHYCGGFCIDAGQKYEKGLPYLPSHSPGRREPSLFVGSWDFPSDWLVSLLGMESPIAMDSESESDFMNRNSPIERSEGLETIAALYHGLLPAVIAADYSGFLTALRALQLHGWNTVEFGLQAPNTLQALRDLWASQIAGGLSSFGPAIFAVHTVEQTKYVQATAAHHALSYHGPFHVIPKSGMSI